MQLKMQLKIKQHQVTWLAVHSSAQENVQQKLKSGTDLLRAFMP